MIYRRHCFKLYFFTAHYAKWRIWRKKQISITKNNKEGGMLLLLKEVRHTVFKNNKRHNKLLFNLLIKEEALFISAKCRDVAEPVDINLETILEPYLEPQDVKDLRRIAKSIYKKKLRKVS
jgi:hypothetical protein